MLKTIGVLFVVCGATGAGAATALGVRYALNAARQLCNALERMKNEIDYCRTPLPVLMELLAKEPGPISPLFAEMAGQLSLRREASVYAIVRKSLNAAPALPGPVRQILLDLAPGLGRYDVEGQLRAIDLASAQARALLEQYRAEQRGRVRSCCTLGLCAGLAIAIMVL